MSEEKTFTCQEVLDMITVSVGRQTIRIAELCERTLLTIPPGEARVELATFVAEFLGHVDMAAEAEAMLGTTSDLRDNLIILHGYCSEVVAEQDPLAGVTFMVAGGDA